MKVVKKRSCLSFFKVVFEVKKNTLSPCYVEFNVPESVSEVIGAGEHMTTRGRSPTDFNLQDEPVAVQSVL